MALTPNDITKAKLIAAVLCRVVDYHAATQKSIIVPGKQRGGITLEEVPAAPTALELAEARVAVAIENVLDAGALE
jgi:hypothetical protein